VANGIETLGSIDRTLRQVRQGMQETDQEIQRHTEEHLQLRREQATQFRELARVRLELLNRGDIVAGFDAAEQHVQELLARRAEKLALLERKATEIEARLREAEERRTAQQQAITQAAAEVDRIEGVVQGQLMQQEGYRKQLEATRQAEDSARMAAEKAKSVAQQYAEKSQAYQADKLFMYLWNRQYGTSHYRANPVARRLDAWVARICRYEDARPNYQSLQETPRRLETHAQRTRLASEPLVARLKELEEEAARAGGVIPFREALQREQARADEIDTQIQSLEEQYRAIMNQRTTFAGGEDEDFRTSLETLMQQLQREPLPELLRKAERTPTNEDNVIVRRLMDLNETRQQVENSLQRAKQLHERHLDRLQQLERVRRDYKRNRYDDVHSDFRDGALVSTMLNSFLRGLVTSAEVWTTLERQHRYRRMNADPRFGTGEILGPTAGSWTFPFPSGGGGFQFPSGGWGGGGGGGGGGGFADGADFREGGSF